MASDDRRADRWADWGDLGRALEASEPLNIAEIHRLRESNTSVARAEVLPVDVWYDLRTFWQMPRQTQVAWNSEEVKGWWSTVQASSSVISRMPLTLYQWHGLMKILMHADVSRIKHMVLGIELHTTDEDKTIAYNLLGLALRRRDFSNLKTLILYSGNDESSGLESPALADAIRARPGLVNLRTLALPRCLGSVLSALATSSVISQLTSFSVHLATRADLSALDTMFKSGCLERLRWLEVVNFYDPGNGREDQAVSEVSETAIRSQNLPTLACLYIVLGTWKINLGDLVRASRSWFASLEAFHICDKNVRSEVAYYDRRMKSEDVFSLVVAVMEDPLTQLALKSLSLPVVILHRRAVLALIRLAVTHKLPQLQELELVYKSCSTKVSECLVDLLLSCSGQGGRSSMPNLRRLLTPLNLDKNPFDEADAKRLVKTYNSNQFLTADVCIHWQWYRDLSLEARFRTFRARNLRLGSLREKLGGDVGELVPHMSAKVFLCGYPEVGKTTLRRALLRSLGIRTKLMWETRRVNEPRTRGIEISRIKSKKREGISLLLWDLAGQQEYHILHGSFLTDLGFEGGKATTFVLVFKATFGSDVNEKMGYWLRFVASGSLHLVKRHVVIVLNCFNGVHCTEGDQRLWKALIGNFAKEFCDKLDIHLEPFIVDVRKAAPVQPVKDYLVNHALALLHDVDVPRLCLDLLQELKQWSEGQACNQLPILTWQAVEEIWRGKRNRRNFSVAILKYAASYLHEIGEIIYFDKVSKSRSGRAILVSDPEWFCRRVVGDLLLPAEMLKGGSSIEVGADGSISVFMFESFFQDLLVGGVQSDDVISMLELLGLCYRRGEQEIIVPALIREDNYSSIYWEGKGSHSVMGRCLAAKNTDMNIIPESLFRRLQVDLALDSDFGGREDSDYKVGKSFGNFKCGELLVLVQFDVDHSDPTDDRLDILVKSAMLRDPAEESLAQVKCICDLVQKVVDLCALFCDGLTYDIKVIQPYSATARTPNMSDRKLMTLEHIKQLLVKGKEYLAWQVDGHNVKTESVLSKAELERLVRTVQREYDDSMADAVAMGLLPKDSLYGSEALQEKSMEEVAVRDVQDMSICSDPTDLGTLSLRTFLQAMEKLEAVVRREGRDTRQYMDKKSTERVLEFRHGHELLVKHIQAQQSFSIEEKESSVPRYMFLSRKQGLSSVPLMEALQSTYHLHLLCEAHFGDGFLHEVSGQEGIALTKSKEWWWKMTPWLRRSLQVVIMVGKTVGNVYLPGVFNLIPDVNLSSSSDALARAVDKAARLLLENDNQGPDEKGRRSIGTHPVNVKEKWVAQAVVKDLMNELGNINFVQKIGLMKVVLRAAAQPHAAASSSAQAQPSVVRICKDCCKKYGDRAIRI